MFITLAQMEVFALILARVAGIFVEAPVFNSRTFPTSAKTALAIWMTMLLWFVVPVRTIPEGALFFLVFVIKEFVIGFLIGFVCQILFSSIQAGGDLIDLQMGTSIATALDPNTGTVASMIGRFCFFIALVVFLIINGHHMILSAVHNSFRVLPVGAQINISSGLITQLITLVSTLLLLALQLAVPALILIFLSDFSFGIVSRVAPQVNVFMLGFQVKPSLGLLVILFSLPLIMSHIALITGQMLQELLKLFVNLR